MFAFSRKNILALTLIALNYFSFSQPLGANPSSDLGAKGKDLDFGDDGRPGRQTSGGSRGSCPKKSIDLTALMPYSNMGKTAQDRPTFWVYVPYTNQEIAQGEFAIQYADRSDLYRAPFQLLNTPGFVQVTLPPSVPALAKNHTYRWYFKLYCKSDVSESKPLPSPTFVQGWIERVEPPTGNSSYWLYAENKIWYDAIASLANLRLKNPQDPLLANDWRVLLRAKGVNLDFGAPDTFVGSVKF